jgi:hypothetical protein
MHNSVGSVAFIQQVIACCSEDSNSYIFVDVGTLEAEASRHSSIWRLSGTLELWPVTDLVQAEAWYVVDGGKWTVLHA